MRHLSLVLVLTACSAAAPTPGPGGDAATDANSIYDTANGCPARHVRIGEECISNTDSACGPRLVQCPSGTFCALVSGGGPLTREDVRCERE